MDNPWLERVKFLGAVLIFGTILFVAHEFYVAGNLNLDNELDCHVRCRKNVTFDRGKSYDKCYCETKLMKIYK